MTTREPLTEAEKQYIYDRKQAGASLQQIANELSCALYTARKWWRHVRDGTRVRPRRRPATGVLRTYPDAVRQAVVALKRAHPHWGPANVLLELKRQAGSVQDKQPSRSRLSALFKAECPQAVQSRQPRRAPAPAPAVVTHAHQRWQIDGQERIRLGEQDVVTLLNIRDPVGALMIASRAFMTTTQRGWRKLERLEVQDTLRLAFMEWGLPLEVQTDREDVYTGAPQGDFPSLFTLWLVGLGVKHVVSRPHRPTDQSQVERTHRTLGDMAWKDTLYATIDQLQDALDDYRGRYNEELPVRAADCRGRPPLTVHPEAQHSGRPFHPHREDLLFDLHRVDAYLASLVWTRQVDTNGRASVGNRHYRLHARYAGQTVSVRFISDSRAFHFQAADGTLLAERHVVGLGHEDIIGRIAVQVPAVLFFQLPLPLEGV